MPMPKATGQSVAAGSAVSTSPASSTMKTKCTA